MKSGIQDWFQTSHSGRSSAMSMTTLNEDPKLSFWDVGGYKPNIRRIRSGATQLEDYTKMIKERMEIEQKYGKSLQNWHAKWALHVDTNVPSSIIKHLWLELLEEGRELSHAHLNVKDRCNDELVKTLEVFRKDNYHYATIRGMRETREMDAEFDKAQRQWKKLLEKADCAKKAYHTACQNEKSSYIQLMNSQRDASTTTEHPDKTQERHGKCRELVAKTRKAYESTLSEIHQFNPVYTENMTFVFEKCQQLELKRLRFATEMLSNFQDVLSGLVRSPKLAQLHDTVKKKFGGINDAQLSDDLREWSKLYGVEARLVRPSFEEYSPEFRSIAANGATMRRLNEEDCSSVVVLTKQTITSNELPSTPSVVPSLSRNGVSRQPHHNASLLNTSPPNSRTESVFSGVAKPRGPTSKIYNYTPPLSQQMAINGLSNIKKVANVRKESEVIAYSHQKVQPESISRKSHSDSGASDIGGQSDDGPQIRGRGKVLYDYTPIEGDEIALTKDEFLDVLSEPDSLGWCYGRKGSEEGLFPASYVMIV